MEKKILVAVGYSKISVEVLKYAAHLACKRGAQLTILHARIKGRFVYEPIEIFEKVLAENNIDVPYKVLSPLGISYLEITKELEQNKYDLIVLGGHAHNIVGRFFMGKTARYVLHNAKCPVFLFKRHEDLFIPKIIVPVDFSAIGKKVMKISDEWARLNGDELVFIHVDKLEVSKSYWDPEIDEVWQKPKENLEERLESLKAKLKKFVESENIRSPHTLHVVQGNPALEILAYQEEVKADLIMVAAHSYTILERVLIGSTTDTLLNRGKSSLYVYKENPWRKG